MFHEPLIAFSYMAAITERLEFVTGILILPQRQTALVAKQTAEVDVLTGGRLRLGVGIGWNHVEYEALNQNVKNRGRRCEEQIEPLSVNTMNAGLRTPDAHIQAIRQFKDAVGA